MATSKRRSPYRRFRLKRQRPLRVRLPRERPVAEKSPIRPNRVPKKRNSIFSKLRSRRNAEGATQSLHAWARSDMNRRRSQLRAKEWHGGKQYVGTRRHGAGNTTHHSRAKHALSAKQKAHLATLHRKGRAMTAKQRAHLAYLHSHYHFGKKKA